MGMPSVRLGDTHTWVTPSGSPSTGVVVVGSPKVMSGGVPMAALLDSTIGGPIIVGSPTVLVGGKPAARLGDPVAMSGVIVVGNPTVLVA